MDKDNVISLPKLRANIKFKPASDNPGYWLLHDAINNQYYEIGSKEKFIVAHWQLGTVEKIIEAGKKEKLQVTEHDVEEIHNLLKQHALIKLSSGEVETLSKQNVKEQGIKGLAKQHLSIRVPLFKSDPFLDHTYPYIKWIFSKTATLLISILALFCLFLLLQNSNEISTSLPKFLGWEAPIALALLLFINKVIHELGHAYTAKHYGLSVPNMGVVLMAMIPIMYTDTSSSWQLDSSRKRLAISLGGIRFELYFLVILTIIWSSLPTDNLFRDIILFMITVNLLATLFINLNPLMKFDGYYALSDFLGVKNMQPRAVKWYSWFISNKLYSIPKKTPEELSSRSRSWMIFYGAAMMAYKVFLYLGITLMIYQFFFKLLGIVLFIVEFYLLLIKPISLSLYDAYKNRAERTRKLPPIIWILGIIIVLVIIPIPHSESLPATYSIRVAKVYTPYDATVDGINTYNGLNVRRNQNLIKLKALKTESDLSQVQARISSYTQTLRQVRKDDGSLANRKTIQASLSAALKEEMLLKQKISNAQMIAPISGSISQQNPQVYLGNSLAKNTFVMLIKNKEKAEVKAWINGKNLKYLHKGMVLKFIPDALSLKSINMKLIRVDKSALYSVKDLNNKSFEHFAQPISYHLSSYGGTIETTKKQDSLLFTNGALYQLELEKLSSEENNYFDFPTPVTGILIVRTAAKPIVASLFKNAYRLLQRELSF